MIEQDKVRIVTGELKQQRTTAAATKTSLKKWICVASNYVALIPSRLILRMLANFFEADSKGLYQSSAKEKESCCLVVPSSTNREIGQFHVLVVQWRQRNVQNSLMMVSKGGAVVRALASHQCGPGSNPGVDAICGLSLLLVLSLAPRDFSPGTPVFPSP